MRGKMDLMRRHKAEYVTGSRRGYVKVKERGVESELMPIPKDLKGLRGNAKWSMRYLADQGATHYTVAQYQGVPNIGYSNYYCYAIYSGYILTD